MSLCPHRCPGCHSQYLQTDCGEELTIEVVKDLINKNDGITCILFLGGDADKVSLINLAKYIKSNYDSDIKLELDKLNDELNNIPLYITYSENLEKVNQMISYVNDELTDYFYKIFNIYE